MSYLSKLKNLLFDGGSPNLPLSLKDRYYGQDLVRDFRYFQHLSNYSLKESYPSFPVLFSGGLVTQGTGVTLNITPAKGLVNYSVTVPDTFTAAPHSVTTADIIAKVESTQQTNLNIGTPASSTTYYVKLRYAEANGNTRTRARSTGTYAYEVTPSFIIVVDAVANTDYDVLLATFTSTGGGGGVFTIRQRTPTKTGGWDNLPQTFTYSSADSPTFVMTANADLTNTISVGQRIKLDQSQALTSYWSLTADCNDSVGSNNGTPVNSPTYTAGKFSTNALTLVAASNQCVSIVDSTSLKPTGDFTIGFWLKATGAPQIYFQSFSMAAANSGKYAGFVIYSTSQNILQIYTGKNTGSTTGIDLTILNATTAVNNDSWHYIVYTQKNNWGQIYIDGYLNASGYMFTPAYYTTNYVRIGCLCTDGSNAGYTNGQIQDLFLINGYALDEQTIRSKYVAGTAQGAGAITVTKNFITSLPPTYYTSTTLPPYNAPTQYYGHSYMAYWNFNNVWTDSFDASTPVNTITPTNATLSTSQSKFGGYSVSFNGTSAYGTLTDSTFFHPTGDFTIGCWIYVSAKSSYQTIFQSFSTNGGSSYYQGILLNISNTTGCVYCQIGANTGASPTYSITGTTDVTNSTWHYIVYTQKNNYGTIYIDGTLNVSGQMCAPVYNATNYVKVGCRCLTGSPDLYFGSGSTAYIDDIFLINGWAADASTVATMYAANAAFGTGTAVTDKTIFTLDGGTDFSLANSTINNVYFSSMKIPFGFNCNENKWSVQVWDQIDRSKTGADTGGTFYGGTTAWLTGGNMPAFYFPLGLRYISFDTTFMFNRAATIGNTVIALTSNPAGISIDALTSYERIAANALISYNISKQKLISLTAKTQFYLLGSDSRNSSDIYIINSISGKTIIKSTNAYL